MRSIRSLLLALLVPAAAGGHLAWQVEGRHEPLPEGLVPANSRIEGDRITVASKVVGRVMELPPRERDEVEEGQLLLRLEDHAARARLQAAERAVDATRARVDAEEKSFRQTARDLQCTRRLYRESTAPKQEPEPAQTAWRVARIERVALPVTTHYMSEAEHCDHTALMYAVRIIADASPAELKARLERRVGRFLSVTTGEPLQALERL